jgi:transcriptional regulator with XRE-family HTH domain
VSARIKRELGLTGLSQRQFAGVVGVSDSQLSKLLRGEVDFTLGLLDRVCRELGLSIAEVIDAADFETRGR